MPNGEEKYFLYLPNSFFSVTAVELRYSTGMHGRHSLSGSIFGPAISVEHNFFCLSCSTMYLLFPLGMPGLKYAGFYRGPDSWRLEDCLV